ncbi:hypothetical protein XELAEV_18024599mg [Xenopus laevis]|uniref:Secreted protein n=1 Tax=Xenopus laevis TaxID=8355 RepID=A0A974CY08_XENLA|nr:hypothetical protein XELAEV_18024599mg [Xenopus laevis]
MRGGAGRGGRLLLLLLLLSLFHSLPRNLYSAFCCSLGKSLLLVPRDMVQGRIPLYSAGRGTTSSCFPGLYYCILGLSLSSSSGINWRTVLSFLWHIGYVV